MGITANSAASTIKDTVIGAPHPNQILGTQKRMTIDIQYFRFVAIPHHQ